MASSLRDLKQKPLCFYLCGLIISMIIRTRQALFVRATSHNVVAFQQHWNFDSFHQARHHRCCLGYHRTRQARSRRATSSPCSATASRNNHCSSNHSANSLDRTRTRSSTCIEQNDANFLRQVETSVNRVLAEYDESTNILDIDPNERESLGIARNLNERIQAFRRNNNCPRCWLQQAHCICADCQPLTEPALNDGTIRIDRIFLLMHHKEICMTVDTAKIIMAAYPTSTRLVVGGIGSEYQDSMKEFLHVMKQNEKPCLVLFPSEDALTFDSILAENDFASKRGASTATEGVNLIVLDGTWEQARRLYKRYIPEKNGPRRVKLSIRALETLLARMSEDSTSTGTTPTSTPTTGYTYTGRQLRRHPELFREISTLAALHLLLHDINLASTDPMNSDRSCQQRQPWDALTDYQERADLAACTQLGEPRTKASE